MKSQAPSSLQDVLNKLSVQVDTVVGSIARGGRLCVSCVCDIDQVRVFPESREWSLLAVEDAKETRVMMSMETRGKKAG